MVQPARREAPRVLVALAGWREFQIIHGWTKAAALAIRG